MDIKSQKSHDLNVFGPCRKSPPVPGLPNPLDLCRHRRHVLARHHHDAAEPGAGAGLCDELGGLWRLGRHMLPNGIERDIYMGEHPFTSFFDVRQGYKVLTQSHMWLQDVTLK